MTSVPTTNVQRFVRIQQRTPTTVTRGGITPLEQERKRKQEEELKSRRQAEAQAKEQARISSLPADSPVRKGGEGAIFTETKNGITTTFRVVKGITQKERKIGAQQAANLVNSGQAVRISRGRIQLLKIVKIKETQQKDGQTFESNFSIVGKDKSRGDIQRTSLTIKDSSGKIIETRRSSFSSRGRFQKETVQRFDPETGNTILDRTAKAEEPSKIRQRIIQRKIDEANKKAGLTDEEIKSGKGFLTPTQQRNVRRRAASQFEGETIAIQIRSLASRPLTRQTATGGVLIK